MLYYAPGIWFLRRFERGTPYCEVQDDHTLDLQPQLRCRLAID